MKPQLHALPSKHDETFILLETYRDLDRQIKALTKEKDKLGKKLKEGYFLNHDEYIHEGRLLATYYRSVVIKLDQAAFKLALPDVFKQYQTIGEQRTFLLK